MSITLYDLAREVKPNRGWSFNAWKTRLVLNYKGIPFTTAWVNHETLTPTIKSLGVPPHTSGPFEYTVPTIQLLDASVIADSSAIASKLEALYPSPSLHLDSELEDEVNQAAFKLYAPLMGIYVPKVAHGVVEKSTAATFIASREKLLGASLEEIEKSGGGEEAWEAAEPGFVAMKQLLTTRKKDEGPFIHGSEVCYADFLLVAFFEACRRAGEDMFERVIQWDANFGELYAATEAWRQNDE